RPDRGSIQSLCRCDAAPALGEVRDAEEMSAITIDDRWLAPGRRLIEHPNATRFHNVKVPGPDRPGYRRRRWLGADVSSLSGPGSSDHPQPSPPGRRSRNHRSRPLSSPLADVVYG